MKTGSSSRGSRHNLAVGLLFISPWLIGFVLWTAYSLLSSLYYSFTRYDLLRPPVWSGFANYIELFIDDPQFPIVIFLSGSSCLSRGQH